MQREIIQQRCMCLYKRKRKRYERESSDALVWAFALRGQGIRVLQRDIILKNASDEKKGVKSFKIFGNYCIINTNNRFLLLINHLYSL
jgi:hypothetical protein